MNRFILTLCSVLFSMTVFGQPNTGVTGEKQQNQKPAGETESGIPLDEEVRRSTSKICHPKASGWYDRLEEYEEMDLQTCLEDDGRLPHGFKQQAATDAVENVCPKGSINDCIEKLEDLTQSLRQQVPETDKNQLVKVTDSGICHPRESPYWDRIQQVPKITLTKCLQEGNRLPKVLQAEQRLKEVTERCKQGDENCASDLSDAVNNAAQSKAETQRELNEFQEFAGFRFGVGIAFTKMDSPLIREVTINDGEVVVTKETEQNAEVLFETHKFWHTGQFGDMDWGWGPFVAVSLATDGEIEPLDRYGIGLMFGFKGTDSDIDSWNLGIARFVDTGVTKLDDELSDGMQTDQTRVADITRTTEETGLMIMISANW